MGGSAEAVVCDHTDPDAVRRVVADVLERHGRIDVLVNNAWGGHDFHEEADGEEVWDEPMEQFRAMLLAGAYSDFVTDMTVLKHAMGPAGAGIILTTTWHTPEPPGWVPYESSKAAKNRLVYALGHHLREKGIACVAVAPGWMRTELMEAHHPRGARRTHRDPALRRSGRRRARRRPRRHEVHRPHDGRRGARPRVRLHRPRRHPARPQRWSLLTRCRGEPEPLLITVAPSGAETAKADCPQLPTTLDELVETAVAFEAAGAAMIDVHIRDDEHRPTLDGQRLKDTVAALRESTSLIVQLSTGGSVHDPLDLRLKVLDAEPDSCSLTMGTTNFGDDVFSNPWPFVPSSTSSRRSERSCRSSSSSTSARCTP